MTLVVGRVTGQQVRILSDFLVTNPEMPQTSPLSGVLKAVILQPELCVCLAGRVAPALEAIREVERSLGGGIDDALTLLLDAHRVSDAETDFLVGEMEPPRLHRITGGHIERDLLAAHIGDSGAFSRYQELYATPPPWPSFPFFDEPADQKAARLMSDAFDALLREASFPTVGGFTVLAASGTSFGAGFTYLPRWWGQGFAPVSGPGPKSLLTPVSQEEGGYYYTILTPTVTGIGAIGAYFPQPQLGALFFPVKEDGPRLYRSVTCDEFRDRVRGEFGFELSGVLM